MICFGHLCSGIFFVRQCQYFLVNILAVLFCISEGSETNSNFVWEVGLVGSMEKLKIIISQVSNKLKLMLKLSLAKLWSFWNGFWTPDILNKRADILTKKQVGPTSESNSNLKCIFGPKQFEFIRILISKKFWLKKVLVQKISGPNRFQVQKDFGSNKILGQKKFVWVQRKFWSKKFWSATRLNLSWLNLTWSKLTWLVLTGLDQSWLDLTCLNLTCPDLTYPDSNCSNLTSLD